MALMFSFVHLFSVLSCGLLLVLNGAEASKRNVLFIVIDDLRPSLGCYGGPIISPNIDQLAAQSALFTNAMAQQSLCAPSRVSFLTGRRPDTTRLYDLKTSYWRTFAGNYTTLPQHFKDNGYVTISVGKIFHPGTTSGNNDDYPFSWSLPAYHSSTQQYQRAKVCPTEGGKLQNNVMCPVNVTNMPEKTLPDLQSLQTAQNILKILSSSMNFSAEVDDMGRSFKHNVRDSAPYKRPPFFLAVGFHKPHIPWKYPKEFRGLYPIDSVKIASNPNVPEKLPPVAYEDYHTLRFRDDISALNLSFPYGTIPLKYHASMRQNYYAAASYMDSLVGKLLQALEDGGYANNTIISLIGDHGWQLGEHAEWCKYSNFQLATRVPLLVHVPGVTDREWSSYKKFSFIDALSSRGSNRDIRAPKNSVRMDEFVELVDVFPTLAELAKLSIPPVCPPEPLNVTFCSEGYSFAGLIKDKFSRSESTRSFRKKYSRWKNATFSQYPRPEVTPQTNTDSPILDQITVMGYSMRTKDYHYTEWVSFNHTTFAGDWSDLKARELYVNSIDPDQNDNVADDPKKQETVHVLSQQLRRGWRDSLPSPSFTESIDFFGKY